MAITAMMTMMMSFIVIMYEDDGEEVSGCGDDI